MELRTGGGKAVEQCRGGQMIKSFDRKLGPLVVALALTACGGQSGRSATSEEIAGGGGSEAGTSPERIALAAPASSAGAEPTSAAADRVAAASVEANSVAGSSTSGASLDGVSSEMRSIFQAAGFTYVQKRRQWESGTCGDPPAGASYEAGAIGTIEDINGDGRPEVIVTEGGAICFGMSGLSFQLLTRQPNGQWKVMTAGIGIPELLATRGSDNFPDIQVGGPGFCFPVVRWSGGEYKLHRHEYEGKPCSPPR